MASTLNIKLKQAFDKSSTTAVDKPAMPCSSINLYIQQNHKWLCFFAIVVNNHQENDRIQQVEIKYYLTKV